MNSRMPIKNIIHVVGDPPRLQHLVILPTRPERIPRAGKRISGGEKSEPLGGGKGEQPCADCNIINVVHDPSRLERSIIHPTRPGKIPRAGKIFSDRDKSEPSGGGKGDQPYAD